MLGKETAGDMSFTVTSRCRGGMTQSFSLLLHATDYCTPALLTVPDLLSVKVVCKPTLMIFFSPPSTGVVAVSDPRGPAADPPGPGLGASRGGALCGAGGLLTQQVGGLTPGQSSLSLILFHSSFHCLLAIFIPLLHFTPLSFFVVCMSLVVSCIVPPQCPQKHDDRCWISSLCGRIKQEEVEEKAAQHARGKVMLYRWLFIHTLWFRT